MSDLALYPPSLDGDSISKKREEIRKYFHNSYNLFEKIFEVLKDDSVFYMKSEPTRHPMIFYFGHTAVFFINKLFSMKIIQERVNPEFEAMFAVGVDEMSWDDLDSSNYRWGTVKEVRSYRTKVKKLVDNLISTLEFTLPIKEDSPMWIILMGIEHEKIHIETSLVLHRQMPLKYIKDTPWATVDTSSNRLITNEMVKIESKTIKLGKDETDNYYGWDNEYGSFSQDVESFEISKYLVSQGEYMPFVLDGGYENEEFWDEEGKKFLKLTKVKHPTFWVYKNGNYRYRTLTKVIDMPLDFPVEVNALEAEAFCRYKSKKDNKNYLLPSESEYRIIYDKTNIGEIADAKNANVNFRYFSSSSVDKFNHNGLYDVVGNVWQWSRTAIFGFDGFKVHKAYDDFSVPTFDNKHSLILGSSWASSGNLIMKHSRYAFRKHFFQNAGFRYVISNQNNHENVKNLKLDKDVLENFDLQYKSDFSKKCTSIALKYIKKSDKVLDLGCGVGRISFELAKTFKKVDSLDISARFIQVAVWLQNRFSYDGVDLKTLSVDGKENRISFMQGDPLNLKFKFNSYDMVIATNTKDRFYEPTKFLKEIEHRINKNGILVLIVPNDYKLDNMKSFKKIYKESVNDSIVMVLEKNDL